LRLRRLEVEKTFPRKTIADGVGTLTVVPAQARRVVVLKI
jgi:hypothetical protein